MIVKRHIEKDLQRLHTLYSDSVSRPDPAVPVYFSKLGVLELTGWVEESFDIIAARAAKGRVKESKFQERVRLAIRNNHGFSYDNNFIIMMAKIIGLSECERLERHLNSDGTLDVLKGELNAVLEQRRKAAHVNLARTTIAFDSPSVSLGRLRRIYPIIKGVYSWFC